MTFIQYNSNKSPFGGIASLILIVLFFFGLFWLAGKAYTLLMLAAPFLLILAAILDYHTIINYVKYILGLFKTNVLMALGLSALTFFAFPLVALFLVIKAYASRKLKSMLKPKEEAYASYEEVVEEEDDFLELPNMPKQQTTSKPAESSDYEQLFD